MKKILTCLMAAVVLIMSLPITALAATNFNPQISTGYYPDTIPRSIPKAYTCHLGGTSEEISAEITYGTPDKAIRIDIGLFYYDAYTQSYPTTFDSTNGESDLEVIYGFLPDDINAGSRYISAAAEYYIMSHQVASLSLP